MPQPIDLQTETARIAAAERVQQVMDRASLAAQQRLAAQVEANRVAVETSVQQTPHAQSEQVDAQGRRRNPDQRKRKRQPAPNAPTQMLYDAEVHTETGESEEGRQLDITI